MKYLLVDVGSTTTKAILCEVGEETAQFIALADAPTTVEAPFEDVQIGLENALRRIGEQLSNRVDVNDTPGMSLVREFKTSDLDGLFITSSAGGGLQMLVIGLVRSMTGESAERAALGAGGVILDILAQDDHRQPFERIERIRHLKPDMILLAGGVEGGAVLDVAVLAEMLFHAAPQSRFDSMRKLPLIYAGNSDLHPFLKERAEGFELCLAENLRPSLSQENFGPVRRVIQEQFMEHVMAHAPGYAALKDRVDAPIMPTPMAVTRSLRLLADNRGENILAVDIGGATTDIFSIVRDDMHRSVSANLGMSYSALNVLKEAGVANIMRWLPSEIDELALRDWLHNKMLRPTTLPHTVSALKVEQALAREALRLAFQQHLVLAAELRGNKPIGDWRRGADTFFGNRQRFGISDVDLIIGSGGVISHAPKDVQSALMLIDAFLPAGYTELLLDRHFSLPHIGVLSQVHPEHALKLLLNQSLVPLGASIAPRGVSGSGDRITRVTVEPIKGASKSYWIPGKCVSRIPLPADGAAITVEGVWSLDFGRGFWRNLHRDTVRGTAGLFVDLRGRPLPWSRAVTESQRLSSTWYQDLSGEED
ncbi:MAG: glutamate mutase L [Symbiobacteriaceae bacterium]|nr:glutamate mutase L [Symbiobacteriaceae bacterium]